MRRVRDCTVALLCGWLCAIPAVAHAQANVTRTQPIHLLFETVVPDTPGGSGSVVRQLSHVRYLVAGSVATTDRRADGLMVWLDSSGVVLKQRHYGGAGDDFLSDAYELPGGDIVSVGYSARDRRDHADIWLLRVDSTGSTVWERRFAGPDTRKASAMSPLADGGFVLLAQTGAPGREDALVIRTDASGRTVWTKTVGASGSDRALAMSLTPHGVAAAGVSVTTDRATPTPWAFELDLDGQLLWEQRYPSLSGSIGQGIAPAVGGFLLTGYGTSPTDSVNQRLFVRVSTTGALLQASRIPSAGESRAMMSVATPTGGHVGLGVVASNGGWDVQFTGLSESVAPTWQALIARTGDERGVHMIATSDGGWVLTGRTAPTETAAGAVLIIKWRR